MGHCRTLERRFQKVRARLGTTVKARLPVPHLCQYLNTLRMDNVQVDSTVSKAPLHQKGVPLGHSATLPVLVQKVIVLIVLRGTTVKDLVTHNQRGPVRLGTTALKDPMLMCLNQLVFFAQWGTPVQQEVPNLKSAMQVFNFKMLFQRRFECERSIIKTTRCQRPFSVGGHCLTRKTLHNVTSVGVFVNSLLAIEIVRH